MYSPIMARTLPPGPPLPATVQAGLFLLMPLAFLHFCHRRYGDRFTVQIPGWGTLVYLAARDDIKVLMRGDPAVYHAGAANIPLAEILGPRSVLVVDDEDHHRSRGLMLPAFHGDSVRRQVAEMVEITADEVSRWPVGERFPLLPRMQAITLEVILRTVIGVHDELRLARLRHALPPMVEIGSPMQLLPPPKMLRNVGLWRRRKENKARSHTLLMDEIVRCRQDPNLARRTDVLAMMVRTIAESDQTMDDDELVDQLVTLLLAGHETTATALAWTFERLTRNPALLARTAEAAETGDDAWLDAVCKESLRSRPVVFQIGRQLTEDVELAGYRIPAGMMLAPSIDLVHRDPRYYPEPAEFRPERFLDQRADSSVWLPFGGGIRRCLGATFAQVEMRTVLREILRRVELTPTTTRDESVKVRHVTLVPRQGAMVTVRRHVDVQATAQRRASA
jgi:cytochrome P450